MKNIFNNNTKRGRAKRIIINTFETNAKMNVENITDIMVMRLSNIFDASEDDVLDSIDHSKTLTELYYALAYQHKLYKDGVTTYARFLEICRTTW